VLHRSQEDGVVVIGQPAHAWVAGQLARAWADPFEPREEVCLAAAQHDVGWAEWEAAPELDPGTRLPYTFSALPPVRRLELWSAAGGLVLSQSRYAALLVSLHGTLLVERFPPRDGEDVRAAVAAYLEREHAFQDRLVATLRGDPRYAAHVDEEALARNRELVFAWDGLSLALLHGIADERTVAGLTLAPARGEREGVVVVSPWPFREQRLTLVCEGRLLRDCFDAEEEMLRALAEAAWTTLTIDLVPAASRVNRD
jgi:Protein of unknown function (DUF3891)